MTIAGRPLQAQDILQQAAQAVSLLSLATVYRNLKALQEEGAIKSVVLPGQNPRYELASHVHHHHFQCRGYSRVFDRKGCPGNLDRMAPSGFTVEDHEIILYGRCGNCSSRAVPGLETPHRDSGARYKHGQHGLDAPRGVFDLHRIGAIGQNDWHCPCKRRACA